VNNYFILDLSVEPGTVQQ